MNTLPITTADKPPFPAEPFSLWDTPAGDSLVIHGADAVELSLPIAGVGSRSYAFIIDWHIRLILALAWAIVVWLVLMARQDWESDLTGYLLLLPPLVIYFFYHPVLEILMHGRTPGKRMAGVRIVTTQGHTPGVGALLMRNIFRLIDSLPAFYALGLTVALFTRRQVRIGDLAAGTLLIYEEKVSAHALARTAGLLQKHAFTPQQQELLQDMLERWTELDRAVRIRLALKFLESLGESPPPETRPKHLDRALRQRLRDLAGEI